MRFDRSGLVRQERSGDDLRLRRFRRLPGQRSVNRRRELADGHDFPGRRFQSDRL
jgi:hypothetical protein